MKTTLTIDIEYDPNATDPEGLASAMDRLLETILSTPGIMDEYNNPTMGEFFVAAPPALPSMPRIVLNISGGILQDVFSSAPDATVVLCDWDCDGTSGSENGIVKICDGHGGTKVANVAGCPLSPLSDLEGTEVGTALKAAGLDWNTANDPAAENVRRWVIYEPDAGALLTTRVYDSYEEACEDALTDTLVLPLAYQNLTQ
jgi:hypothetical protein